MPNAGFGLQELVLIGVLVLLLFGPKGVAGIMRDLGRMVAKLKKYRDEFTRELMAMSEPVVTPEEHRKAERKRIRDNTIRSMKEMDTEQRQKENKDIRAHLETLPEFKAARRIFCFAALPGEIDTLSIIADLLKDGREVIVPYCIKETRDLGLAQIRDIKTDLEKGVLDIPEPRMELRVPMDPLSIDLFLVPGLSFDHELVRLGRGAGYFDRFLKDIKGKKPIWGLAFNCQIYPYTIPREEHDINPDLVISPYSIIRPRT